MLADVKEWLREEPRQALALGISAVALLLSFLEVVPGPVDPAWLAVLLCGVPIIKEGAEGLFTRFDIKADVLVSLALLASVIIGEIFAAGEVAFIMQLGALLEERTVAKARAGIERLVHLTPRTARRLDGTAESIIPAEEVRVDDLLRVLPGETIPVDGIIVSGQTAIDQSVMTGESLPVDKGPGDTVSSGTVNQFGAFDMRAVKVGEDSSLQRMIRLVQSADAGKARIVGLADRWATWIVVVALTAAALAAVLGERLTLDVAFARKRHNHRFFRHEIKRIEVGVTRRIDFRAAIIAELVLQFSQLVVHDFHDALGTGEDVEQIGDLCVGLTIFVIDLVLFETGELLQSHLQNLVGLNGTEVIQTVGLQAVTGVNILRTIVLRIESSVQKTRYQIRLPAARHELLAGNRRIGSVADDAQELI